MLSLYTRELQKYNAEVTSTLYGYDLIDKLKRDIKYDLILIDDEMEPMNAVDIVKDINLDKKKIIIMLNEDKEPIREHYLKDYFFVDYLIKRDYRN